MVAGPGVVTGLVPWLLTRWKVHRPVPGGVPARALGVALIAAGGAVLTHSFARFVVEGLGTPLPVAPTSTLSSVECIATCGTRCTWLWRR